EGFRCEINAIDLPRLARRIDVPIRRGADALGMIEPVDEKRQPAQVLAHLALPYFAISSASGGKRKHRAVAPPSTAITWPETNDASSDKRNAAVAATSSGSPGRSSACSTAKSASVC